MAFPTSNLPTGAVPWGREVEKQINTVTATVKSNEVNNAARDNQLSASLVRVQAAQAKADAAFAATGIVSGDVAALETDVNTLQTNVYFPGTTTINGGNIRTGTIGATQISSTYVYAGTLNAGQITAGTISGDFISGGVIDGTTITGNTISGNTISGGTVSGTTITGTTISGNTISGGTVSGTTITGTAISGGTISGTTITGGTITGATIQTATSGQRAVIGSTQIDFYGASSGGGAIYGNSDGGVQMQNSSGTYIVRANPSSAALAGGGAAVAVSANRVDLSATLTYVSGSLEAGATTIGGQLTLGSSSAFVAPAIYTPGGGTSAAATNMYVGSNGNVVRTTNTSSRKSKRDIRELEFNSDDYLSIKPVIFKYNEGILREEEKDWDIIGFIAEDFEDAGFANELIVQPDNPNEMVELKYNKMYMFLHKIVADQNQTIKDLTARIEALEGKV